MLSTASLSSFAMSKTLQDQNIVITLGGNDMTLSEFEDFLNNHELVRVSNTSNRNCYEMESYNMYDSNAYSMSAAYMASPAEIQYEIFGFIVVIATGAYVIIENVKYKVGTSIYRAIMKAVENEDEGAVVDVSGRRKWHDVGSEDQLLEKVNGEKGETAPGASDDGMDCTPVYDKETGEWIGEIHEIQPDYDYNSKPSVPTGKIFPPHYHDYSERLGTGSSHHWHW